MNKPLILCIDDEKSILDSLENQLQAEFGSEFVIELAESAEEAKEIIESHIANEAEIPVILADYLMPGCKGDQFLIWVHQKIPETRNIMLTGQAGLDAVVATVNYAGLYRYIAKPWDKNDLLLTVREAITSFRQQKMLQLQNRKLKSLNAQLELINQDLDQRVAIRTRELEDQKKLFQQVFDNSPDGLVIVNETETVLQANSSFLEMFQYTLSEMCGRYLPDLIVPPEFIDESVDCRAKILNGKVMRRETQRHNKDGKLIPVSLMSYPLQIDDATRGAIVIYHDLTLQHETADLLQRSYMRSRRNDFFNGIAASQKKIGNDIYNQGELLGLHLKGSFLLLFLYLTCGEESSKLPLSDKETNIRILTDKMIDRLSLKPEIYAWDSHTGIGILYTMPAGYSGDVLREKQVAGEILQLVQNDFPEVGLRIGVAEFWPEMERFGERYKQARISAFIGPKLHPDQCIHHYFSIGAFSMLSKLLDDEEGERFLSRTIGKIKEYDIANGTSLFITLEKIIAHDNLRQVAEEMFLHYKTIIFRKQSIEKILGVSLDTFEGRTLVGTAMALYYFQMMKDRV